MAFNNSIISFHSSPVPEITINVGALMASNFSFWFSFMFMFAIGYLISHHIIFRSFDASLRHEASSSMMSLTHGTGCLLTAMMILSEPGGFASPNTVNQNLLLQYNMAYFLVDFVHSIVFYNGEYVFLFHHLAALYVFFTCSFVVKHGAYGLIVFLALAESTCICQNVWHTSGLVKGIFVCAKNTLHCLSPWYFGLYLYVRGILAPAFLFKMGAFYFSGEADGFIPMWARVSWLLAIGFGIIISVYWASRKWCVWLHEEVRQ